MNEFASVPKFTVWKESTGNIYAIARERRDWPKDCAGCRSHC